MRINEINPEALGRLVIGSVYSAKQLGHNWVKSTVRDSMPTDVVEVEFLKDYLTLSTKEIIEKWYGGDENVTNMLFEHFSKLLTETES